MSSFTEEDPVKKKLKIESDVYDAFHELFLKNNPSFFDAVEKFKDEITALGAYEIRSCNAADPDNGYCFTEAVCTLKPTRHKLAFANIFLDAFVMLKNFITKKEIPTDDGKRVVLERLVKFLLNTEIQEALSQTRRCRDETDLTVLLVEHVFSKLAASPHFTMDDRKTNQPKVCPCRKDHGKIIYGDTSIGNLDVWHGCLNLIMEGADVVIYTLDGESEIYRDVDSAEDVKPTHFDMTDNSAGSNLVQVAAETIVFSFYHRQIHPDHKNSLMPCMGVSPGGLVFYFYDCVHDVLLGCTHFPLTVSAPFQLSFTAVIAVWLVLNHKHLCNGLSLIDLDEFPKAKFFNVAKNKIDVYRNELRRGQVGIRCVNQVSLDPVSFVNSKFIVLSRVEELL